MTVSVTTDLDVTNASGSNVGTTTNNDDNQDLELLDKQACARFKKAQFALAFKDTERMIELAPASAAGYLRMGDFYSQQGRQRAAIDVYRRGLENVSRSDPRRSELERCKKLSNAQKRKRVDFFHVLTDDIIFDILTYLTVSTRASCAEVSTIWRGRLVSYSELWRVLSYSGKARSTTMYNLIPYIASHVEELCLPIKNYDDLATCSKYFDYMKAGMFGSLQSLTVSDVLASHFECHHVIPALKQLRDTLRHLSVSINGVSDPDTITTVTAILSSCPNLTDLTYYMRYPLHKCAGDFSELNTDHPLVTLSLQPALVDGSNLEPLLRKCPYIRRLVLKRPHPSVLERITHFCPGLEILGYNTRTVPELSEEERKTKSDGLRSLRMPLFKYPLDYWYFFPMLYKNKETIEDLQANWMIGPSRAKWGLFQFHHLDFRFRKLRKLNVWFDARAEDLQPLFWRSISDCTMLTDIDVKGACLFPLVNALVGLPRVRSLCIQEGKGDPVHDWGSDLIRLFNASTSDRFLERVELQDTDAVTDGTLVALSSVPTLKEIALSNCETVTRNGLEKFLQALGGHKSLVSVELAYMNCTRDQAIRILARIPNLQTVKLKRLPHITDDGIIDMAQLVADQNAPLEKLGIRGCPGISRAGFSKVKNDILVGCTMCTFLK